MLRLSGGKEAAGQLAAFNKGLGQIKTAIKGITAGATLVAFIRNIEEAENAAAQLDAAFKNTGATVGRTRKQLDDLASSIQSTTTVSDDLVKEGEAILLTFDKVRGQAFERTVRVAADLSARMGTDLKGAIRQVGLALQDPVAGLTLLRRAGVAFTDEQKALIKGFLETNQAGKAQNLILSELERRFGGSAAAARNTLGGALTGLKNAFGDLFEGTRESTDSAVKGINALSAALSDQRIKTGLDTIIAGFSQLVAILLKAVSLLGQTESKLLELAKTKSPTASAIRGLLQSTPLAPLATFFEGQARAEGAGPPALPAGSGRGFGHPTLDTGGAIEALNEVNVTVKKIVDNNGDLMRELNDSTKTAVERQAAEYIKLKESLDFLLANQAITGRDYNKRVKAALDDLLPEFDLNEIKAKYITLKHETTELGEFMKGVYQNVGRSIHQTLSDALYEWHLSWKNFVNIARRALADVLSAIAISGIKKALTSQFTSSGGTSGGFLAGIGKLFGLAGGGNFDGYRMVGEDGPELVGGRGRVWNQRQLAFMGGGGASINYAPTFNLSIQSSGDDETKRQIAEYVDTRIAQSQQEFSRTLERSGVTVS